MGARARIRVIGIAMLPALMALCLGAPGWAQDSTSAASKTPLKSGIWALEIEMQGTLFSPGWATIAGKKHLGARSALEAGVSVNLSESQIDGEVTRIDTNASGSTTIVVPTDQHNESDLIGIFIHYMGYARVWDRVALLWAAGPVAQWRSGSYADNDSYADGSWNSFSSSQDTWGIGLGAIAGFEWFFAGRLSLGGRVGITSLYEQGDRRLEFQRYYAPGYEYSSQVETGDIDQVSVFTNPTTLVLSIYF